MSAVLGIAAVVVGIPALEASRSARTATDARLLGRASQAIEAGLAAVRADPGRAEYWHALGLAYIGAQRFRDAVAPLDRAYSKASFNTEYAGDLNQTLLLLARSGDAGARSRTLQVSADVVRRDPNNPRAHRIRAVALQESGDSAGAVRAIERALALDPGSTSEVLYVTATQILLAAGRPADALAVAERGIAAIGGAQPLTALRNELDRVLAALGRPPAPRPDPAACTSARWLATPASPQSVGVRVTFTVEATGCPQYEAQIALASKDSTGSAYLSGGAWSRSHTWDTSTLSAGTFVVRAYVRRVGWSGPYQAFFEAEYVLNR